MPKNEESRVDIDDDVVIDRDTTVMCRDLLESRTTSVLASMRSFELLSDRREPEADITLTHKKRLSNNRNVVSYSQNLSDNKKTVALVASLCILSICAAITAIVFLAVGLWEFGCIVAGVTLALGLPGFYYAWYIRCGLKGNKNYDLRKIPLWHSPVDKLGRPINSIERQTTA
eukprot:CFRG0309T1